MALYRATIYKAMNDDPSDTWSNVYLLDVANADAGMTDAFNIASYEADVMYDIASVVRVNVVSAVPGVGGGLTRDANIAGSVTPTNPDAIMPQWNVARVDFSALGLRPEIKYLRLPLLYESVSGQNITNGVFTSLTTAYVTPMLALTSYVNAAGLHPTQGAPQQRVQMRQTTWARRFRPGFHRGWVPDTV